MSEPSGNAHPAELLGFGASPAVIPGCCGKHRLLWNLTCPLERSDKLVMMFRASLMSIGLLAGVCTTLAVQRGASPAAATIPKSALALLPASQPNDTLTFSTHVGSFKILPKGEELPSGNLEFSFTGTVLVTGLDPASLISYTGSVHPEYENKRESKQVFFGTGTMRIIGKFRNCQWFGRDIKFRFKGSGVVRVISEFDKNLETGTYWYEPSKKQPLQNSMIPLIVPQPVFAAPTAMTREEFERQKKAQQKTDAAKKKSGGG